MNVQLTIKALKEACKHMHNIENQLCKELREGNDNPEIHDKLENARRSENELHQAMLIIREYFK